MPLRPSFLRSRSFPTSAALPCFARVLGQPRHAVWRRRVVPVRARAPQEPGHASRGSGRHARSRCATCCRRSRGRRGGRGGSGASRVAAVAVVAVARRTSGRSLGPVTTAPTAKRPAPRRVAIGRVHRERGRAGALQAKDRGCRLGVASCGTNVRAPGELRGMDVGGRSSDCGACAPWTASRGPRAASCAPRAVDHEPRTASRDREPRTASCELHTASSGPSSGLRAVGRAQ